MTPLTRTLLCRGTPIENYWVRYSSVKGGRETLNYKKRTLSHVATLHAFSAVRWLFQIITLVSAKKTNCTRNDHKPLSAWKQDISRWLKVTGQPRLVGSQKY